MTSNWTTEADINLNMLTSTELLQWWKLTTTFWTRWWWSLRIVASCCTTVQSLQSCEFSHQAFSQSPSFQVCRIATPTVAEDGKEDWWFSKASYRLSSSSSLVPARLMSSPPIVPHQTQLWLAKVHEWSPSEYPHTWQWAASAYPIECKQNCWYHQQLCSLSLTPVLARASTEESCILTSIIMAIWWSSVFEINTRSLCYLYLLLKRASTPFWTSLLPSSRSQPRLQASPVTLLTLVPTVPLFQLQTNKARRTPTMWAETSDQPPSTSVCPKLWKPLDASLMPYMFQTWTLSASGSMSRSLHPGALQQCCWM